MSAVFWARTVSTSSATGSTRGPAQAGCSYRSARRSRTTVARAAAAARRPAALLRARAGAMCRGAPRRSGARPMPMLRASRRPPLGSSRSVSAMAVVRSIGRSTIGWTTADAPPTRASRRPGRGHRTGGRPACCAAWRGWRRPWPSCPASVCSSARPSPVITRSAPRGGGQADQLGHHLDPGANRGAGEAEQARPWCRRPRRHRADRRPARPGGPLDGAAVAGQRGVQLGDRAPGRRPSAARRSRPLRAAPVSGFVTSDATTSFTSARRGSRPSASMRSSSARAAPPSGSSPPRRRGSGRPARAAARCRRRWWPTRPRPMVMRSTPASSAARMMSPVPPLEARRALSGCARRASSGPGRTPRPSRRRHRARRRAGANRR